MTMWCGVVFNTEALMTYRLSIHFVHIGISVCKHYVVLMAHLQIYGDL